MLRCDICGGWGGEHRGPVPWDPQPPCPYYNAPYNPTAYDPRDKDNPMLNVTDDYDGDIQRPPAIQHMLNVLSKHITGQEVQPDTCSTCGKKMDLLHLNREFKDGLSLKEWHISHMCQRCQDEFFEGDHDDDFDLDFEGLESLDGHPDG